MAKPLPILLMTRPTTASAQFIADLHREGATAFAPIVSPLIDTVPTGPLPEMTGAKGIIFTSANGVRAWKALGGSRILPCFAVGQATAHEAREAGFDPQIAQGNADALVQMILANRPESPLIHLRGTHARGNIAQRLSDAGLETTEAVIYDQPAQAFSEAAMGALTGTTPVVLPLFSPRSAAQFAQQVQPLAPLFVAAMSSEVAAPLGSGYLTECRVLDRPDGRLMRLAVSDLLTRAQQLVERGGSVKG